MANLSNINNKFLVTTGGNVLIGQTADDGNRLQIDGDAIIKNGTYGKILLRSSSNYLYGDANGVLIAAASDNLRLYTAGTQRLRIDSSGNSTFAAQVSVAFSNPDVSGIELQATVGTNAAAIKITNTGGNFYIGKDKSDGSRISGTAYANAIWAENANPLVFGVSNSEKMRIDSSGKVIINDNTIGDKLLLAGDNAGTARGLMINCSTTTNQGDTWDIDAQSSTGIIKFSTGSSERMRIDSSGNLLLGNGVGNPYLAFLSAGGNGGNERVRIFGYADGGTYGGGLKIQTRNDSNIFGTAITIDHDKNVGIGRTPDVKILDLQSTSGLALRFYNSATFKAGIEVVTTAGQMIGSSAVNDLAIRSQSNILFATGGNTERMRIASNGDITMQENLFFNNGAAFRGAASIRQQSDILILTGGGNGFAFNDDTNAVSNMLIDSGGNVGIGATSPSSKLQVKGDICVNSESVSTATEEIDKIVFKKSHPNGVSGYYELGEIRSKTYGGYSGGLNFYTGRATTPGSYASTFAMAIDNFGHVGIGVTSPASKFEVYGGSSGVNDVDRYIRFKASNGEKRFDFYVGGTGNASSLGMYTSDGTTKNVQISAGGTSYFNGGNVGIGLTTPTGNLSMNSQIYLGATPPSTYTTNTTATRYQSFFNSGFAVTTDGLGPYPRYFDMVATGSPDGYNGGSNIRFFTTGIVAATGAVERMRITSAGVVAITDNNGAHSGSASLIVTKKSSIPYQIWNYSGTSTSFRLQMDEYVTAGNVRQYFNQINAGVSHGFSMTFNTGSVIFGDLEVASATQNSGSAFKKDSKARMTLCQGSNSTALTDLQEYFNPNGAVGKIQTSGSATLFTTSSDYRLKEDLKSFSGLEVISKIPVYDFKWKISDERGYGVMAHELQEVLPQAVGGDKDYEKDHVVKEAKYDDNHNLIKEAEYGKRPSYQTVDYSKIVPLLVKSIQELKAEIELLKSK